MWVISLTGYYLPTQRRPNATHLPDSAALMWGGPTLGDLCIHPSCTEHTISREGQRVG